MTRLTGVFGIIGFTVMSLLTACSSAASEGAIRLERPAIVATTSPPTGLDACANGVAMTTNAAADPSVRFHRIVTSCPSLDVLAAALSRLTPGLDHTQAAAEARALATTACASATGPLCASIRS